MKTQLLPKLTFGLAFLFFFQIGYSQKPSKVDLPASYDFDYVYTLEMTQKNKAIVFDYYLKKGGTYFGFDSAEMNKSNNDSKMFMVMDNDLGITSMFMEMMGKKVVQKTKLKASDFEDDAEDSTDFTVTKIDSKTIMGYECEGFVSENEEAKITCYMTDDVPVSFNQAFGGNMKTPKGFNPAWLKKYAENGLMMEMIYVDKKKSKNNMTMNCIGLEKTDFSIDASKYGSMMSAFGG